MIPERDIPHRLAQHKKYQDRLSSIPQCLNSEPKGLFPNQKPSYFSFFTPLLITEGPDKQKQTETLFCCSCKPVHKMPPIGCFPPALLFHLIHSVLKDQLRQLDKGCGLWGKLDDLHAINFLHGFFTFFFWSLCSSLCFSSLIFLIKFATPLQLQQDSNVTEQQEPEHLHCSSCCFMPL